MHSARRLNAIISVLRPNYCQSSFSKVSSTLQDSSQDQRMQNQPRRTAGIIVIGDEILRGETQDTNSHSICMRLFGMGFQVQRVTIIPDEVAVIAEHVNHFSAAYDCVLTSGGIGPTHDDMTYAGVASAFGLPLVRHPYLMDLLEDWFGSDHSHPAFRMAETPEGSRVVHTRNCPKRFPVVTVRNVYVLPGIPQYMERSLNCVVDDLSLQSSAPPPTASVYVSTDEVGITARLNAAVGFFGERAKFGSYPVLDNNFYRVRLTIESSSPETLIEAESYLRKSFRPDEMVNYDPAPVQNAESRLRATLAEGSTAPEDVRRPLQQAIDLLEKCLTDFKPSEVCLSFNGGKDCTALLHLFHMAMRKVHPTYEGKLNALVVHVENQFPEIEKFTSDSAKRYNLELHNYQAPIKNGLTQFLEARPEIKAILVGNRRTDPHSQDLQEFQMTDAGWPQVMRVFPILNWSYQDVWTFLRHFSIPYCSLYDKGYTSLGNLRNTDPNAKLQILDSQGKVSYLPAHKLKDGSDERNGRH